MTDEDAPPAPATEPTTLPEASPPVSETEPVQSASVDVPPTETGTAQMAGNEPFDSKIEPMGLAPAGQATKSADSPVGQFERDKKLVEK